MKLAVKDESFANNVLNEIMLEINNEHVTVKDFIEARVKRNPFSYLRND